MRSIHLLTAAASALAVLISAHGMANPITPSDIAKIRSVQSPQVDPLGEWVVYVVGTTDLEADKKVSHIWMSRWDGVDSVQLTNRPNESETTPRWSPNGKSLAFLSARTDANQDTQVWILPRSGGEAVKLPGIKGSVEDVVWSPDSRFLALIIHDPDPDLAEGAEKPKGEPKPKPIVISRYKFKEDIAGYQRTDRSRLYLYDLASQRVTRLTKGEFDEALPSFSPDGKTLAFVSNRGADPDRTYDHNIYLVSTSAAQAEPTALTTYLGEDLNPDWESYPAWSPDGKDIAYIQGGPVELFSYGVRKLAVLSSVGGTPRILTQTLDRNVGEPSWSADGSKITFTIEDDGAQWVGAISPKGGKITPVIAGRRVFSDLTTSANGHSALLMGQPDRPNEVYALEKGKLRPVSKQNDPWLATVDIAPTSETRFLSQDGTEIHGFQVAPLNVKPGVKLPTMLYNHGGPQSQFDTEFDMNRQIFAARGYLVVSSNPRGSSGRGEAFAKAIYADWGHKDVQDALAAVDDAVASGLADPDRLAVGGWSYGGMLTNYVMASDSRFKVAMSGASISNIMAGYGTDQYIRDYEIELGKPWEHPEVWARISYPFLHNERITTPTLFMVGDKDMNVPLLNSEQMYQALRSRGVDTGLVIYPGEFHGLRRPSFLKDRMERWLAWYDAHLKP